MEILFSTQITKFPLNIMITTSLVDVRSFIVKLIKFNEGTKLKMKGGDRGLIVE